MLIENHNAKDGTYYLTNTPHHILQRGHNRKFAFVEYSDYKYYLDSLLEGKLSLNIKVYSYCLMTNHILFIVEPADDVRSVSELMKRLAARQTRLLISQKVEVVVYGKDDTHGLAIGIRQDSNRTED
ncbi:MAG: hypothetical protein COC19_05550 [SAR86 cluster bacterium]|uniref:Transposase IS200-like domain-containing protein n=1 Tax=SAR86 cluster bacterium TaxID=2030880 RepID=A0A2A4MLI5_9GAMM|nr:MAG: hypothetical protein COC19_05550 [SAR86 cluster bacterium]